MRTTTIIEKGKKYTNSISSTIMHIIDIRDNVIFYNLYDKVNGRCVAFNQIDSTNLERLSKNVQEVD